MKNDEKGKVKIKNYKGRIHMRKIKRQTIEQMVSNNKKEIELSRTDILDKLEERLEKRIEKIQRKTNINIGNKKAIIKENISTIQKKTFI